MELISIIVPVYNTENYLTKCLDSIINQTYKNLEIILIDDGSTDNSGKICDKYAKRDKRIVVIHKTNGGVSSARNLGLKIANGSYIGFVDADDWIADDMYEILYVNLKKFNADISVCKFKNIYTRNNIIYNNGDNAKTILLNAVKSMEFLLNSKENYMCCLWNKLYKKELLSEFDEKLSIAEDLLQNFKIYFQENIITVFENKEKYFYYIRKGSACHSNIFNNARLKEIKIWKYILKELGNSYTFNVCKLTGIYTLKRIIWNVLFDLAYRNNNDSKKIFKFLKQENKPILKTLTEYNIKEFIYLLLYYLPYEFIGIIWKIWLWKKNFL